MAASESSPDLVIGFLSAPQHAIASPSSTVAGLYAFAFDVEGTCVAHGATSAFVGHLPPKCHFWLC